MNCNVYLIGISSWDIESETEWHAYWIIVIGSILVLLARMITQVSLK